MLSTPDATMRKGSKAPKKTFNASSKPTARKRKQVDNALTRAIASTAPKTDKPAQLFDFNREMHTLYFQGVQVKFPFKPYASQSALMLNVIRALKGQENALLESPTGSGKTLVLLCAVLAWREFEKQRLFKEWKETRAREEQEDAEERLQLNLQQPILLESELDEQPVVEHHHEAEPMDDDDFVPLNREPAQPRVDPADEKKRIANQKKQEMLAAKADTLKRKRMDELDERAKKRQASKHTFKLPKIYFASRTTKQVAQLVGELKRNCPYRPKMAVLASRAHMCINSKVTDKNLSESVNEKCKSLLEHHECSYYSKVDNLTKHASFYAKEKEDRTIWDIEDLKVLGKKTKGCPYFAARQLASEAELIFLPYNFLLDKSVREASGIELDGSIVILDEAHNVESSCQEAASTTIREDELALVLQELHVLVDRTQGIVVATQEEGEPDIQLQKDYQIAQVVISKLVDGMSKNMGSPAFQHQEFDKSLSHWAGIEIVKRLQDSSGLTSLNHATFSDSIKRIAAADKAFKMGEGTDSKTEAPPTLSSNSSRILSSLDNVLSYIFTPDMQYYNDYRMAVVLKKRPTSGLKQRTLANDLSLNGNRDKTLEFWCMNPALAFRDLVGKTAEDGTRKGCRSVLLGSGTLAPLDSFQSELGAPFAHKVEANHVIKSSQVFCGVLGHAPLDPRDAQQGARRGQEMVANFKNCDTYGWQDGLGQSLLQLIPAVPGGVLVFLPSYSLMDKVLQRWQQTGLYQSLLKYKQVYQEPRSGKEDVDVFMHEYREACRDAPAPSVQGESSGAIMFAIFRGKMSEGIDFADNQCRLVIACGIPYPHFKDLAVQEKRNYNNKYTSSRGLLSGNDWYETQAYRALNQSLGRCIRHLNDWGAVLLYDARFLMEKNVQKVSKWIRKELRIFNTYEDCAGQIVQFMRDRVHEAQAIAVPVPVPQSIATSPLPQPMQSIASSPLLVNSSKPSGSVQLGPMQVDKPQTPCMTPVVKSQWFPISSPSKSPAKLAEEGNENKARVNLNRFNLGQPPFNPQTAKPVSNPQTPAKPVSNQSTPVKPIVALARIETSLPASQAPTRFPTPVNEVRYDTPIKEPSSEWMIDDDELPVQQAEEKVKVRCGSCQEHIFELRGPALSIPSTQALFDGYAAFPNERDLGDQVTVQSTYHVDLDTPPRTELRIWSQADRCFFEVLQCYGCKHHTVGLVKLHFD